MKFLNRRDQNISFMMGGFENFINWFTGPIVGVYFFSRVLPSTLSLSNMISGVLMMYMADKINRSDEFLNFTVKHFKLLNIIQLVVFIGVIFGTVNYPSARVIALGAMEALCTYLVFNTRAVIVNRKIFGDQLSKYRAGATKFRSFGKFLGSFLGFFLADKLDIETALTLVAIMEVIECIVAIYIFNKLEEIPDLEKEEA